MILSAIAAMSRNRVIGINNKLPWHIPEDLKYFKEKTKGKILILGRKTFESIGGKPLPGRFHIVITRQSNYVVQHPMVQVVHSLDQALVVAEKKIPEFSEEVFIVGGSEIYSQSLSKLNRLYLTVIDEDYDGDSYFPDFSLTDLELISEDLKSNGSQKFAFRIFESNTNKA